MDNGLENLFRNKLEENEMVTGSDLKDRFMRRLGRREFFRFNVLRFNIYYLTAAVTVLTVAGVILFSDSGTDSSSFVPASQPEYTAETTANQPAEDGPEVSSATEGDSIAAVKQSTGDEPGTGTESPAAEQRRETELISSVSAAESITVSTIRRAQTPAMTSPVMVLSADASVSSGCVPLHVTFTSAAGDDVKTTWSFGDGGTSSLRNPDYIYDVPGTFHVTLTVTDSRGRISTASTVVEVNDRPVASFAIDKDRSFEEGDKVHFTNLSKGAVDYLWDFGDGTFSTLSDPSYRYGQMGNYDVKLVAWSAEGCADSITVSDLFADMGMYIRFPNAFVPNRGGPTGGYYNQRTDEESQVFHPVASGIASYNLKIYSKAGLLVFESNDIELGWDGYHRGGLCAPGVYVWKVRGTYRNGQQFIMAGDVTLLNY